MHLDYNVRSSTLRYSSGMSVDLTYSWHSISLTSTCALCDHHIYEQ